MRVEYTKYRGLNAERRKNLARILAVEKNAITIDFVATVLDLDREKARAFLSSLNRSGWLKLIKPGLYVPVPLESDEQMLTSEDPFVMAPYLFGEECYIGGWSAAAFWGLTDQIFNKTWVMTTKFIRTKQVTTNEHIYLLRHVNKDYLFGTTVKWVRQDKVFFSDPHKTVVDCANFVEGFGLQAFVDILKAYLYSEHKDLDLLLGYAERAKNRTIYKRLGFMLESYGAEIHYVDICMNNISKGPSKLSPNLPCEVYVKRWRLKVPKHMVSQ